MPNYSFDVIEDDGTRSDGVHQHYKHLDDAKAEASRSVFEIAAEQFTTGKSGSVSVEVIDVNGRAVARARVQFSFEDLQSDDR